MDTDDARDLQRYFKEKKKAETKNKLKEVSEYCNCIGELYSKYGQYEEAIQEHTQERHLSEALGDKIGEAVACRKIGECHCFLGQYEDALKHQKRHLLLARECGNSLEEQRAWATIGKTYFCQSETRNVEVTADASKKAEKAYTRALEACEKVKTAVKVDEYMAMKGRLYLNIGLVYDTRGELKHCIDVIKRSVAIAEKFKLNDELYMCHVSLASVYHKADDSSQALRSVDLALRMADKLRNKVGEKEMYIQKAQIQASIGDYLSAKHCLKKAHKVKVQSDTDQSKLVKMFKCVNKMQETAMELESVTEEKRLAELYEVLGDCSAELGNYSDAVKNYLNTLELKHLLQAEKRADIYASLAQTYSDLRQNDEAIHYYRQELAERKDNYEQCCRTLLNIAELEEWVGSKYSVMCKTYMSAFEAARKAKHFKLQIQTLKSLTALQKVFKHVDHLKETEKKLESLVKKHGGAINSSDDDDDVEDDNGAPRDSEDPNGDMSLSDLTLSDESEGDTVDPAAAPGRVKKTKLARRNEKGETPLHRACIDGNLKKVKTLVAQGHPINPRDFCGWLPLHEACNHGHLDIVRCLLDAGAWVNDRGGEKCGGVTPLIDAANCGNMAIVRLLVERGASLQAKDDDGNIALDCLHGWHQRAGDTLGASEILEFKTTEKILSGTGETSGGSNSSTSTQPSSTNNSGASFRERLNNLREKKKVPQERRRKSKATSVDNQSSCDNLSDYDPAPLPLPKLLSHSVGGASEYQAAINSIGSSVLKRLEADPAVTDKDKGENFDDYAPLPALVDAVEDVGDSWLINDIGAVKSKRQKVSSHIGSIFSTSGSRQNGNRKRGRVVEETRRKRTKLNGEDGDASVKISSSYLDKDEENRGKTVSVSSSSFRSSSNQKKQMSASILEEMFDLDQSSNDACPVTSSTEQIESANLMLAKDQSRVEDGTKTASDNLDDMWGSDDELLSHMDHFNDTYSGGDNSVCFSNTPRHGIVSDSSYSNLNGNTNNIKIRNTVVAGNDFDTRVPPQMSASTSSKIRNRQTNAMPTSQPSMHILDNILCDNTNSIDDIEHCSSNKSTDPPRQGSATPNQVQYGKEIGLPSRSPHPTYGSNLNSLNMAQQNPNYVQCHQPQLNHHMLESSSGMSSQYTGTSSVMRIKVKVGTQTLLIPIAPTNQQRTILWLCQETAQRYFNSFLLRPLLSLSTADGSILSPADTISSVLTADDVLTGIVRSWEPPSLEERYTQACRLCLVEEELSRPAITQMQLCQKSGTLTLVNLGLGSVQLQPVFQALEGHGALTELNLSGNKLGDAGVNSLTKLLDSLPVLKVLNLDSTGLTVDGLRTLAASIKQSTLSDGETGDVIQERNSFPLLACLTQLSLGHNTLEDLASSALSSTVDHLPKLSGLFIQGCGFTQDIFTDEFCRALRGRRIEHLSMAENQIGTQGLSMLVDSVHSDCLKTLDIAHCRSASSQNFLSALENFTSHGSCLQELFLSGCHLTESDVLTLNRMILNVPTITTLSVTQNSCVTNKTLLKLITLSAGDKCNLSSITARGCALQAPLGDELLESLQSKMKSRVPLSKLVLSCRGLKQADTDRLKNIWKDFWKDRAVCKIIGVAVSLTVKDI